MTRQVSIVRETTPRALTPRMRLRVLAVALSLVATAASATPRSQVHFGLDRAMTATAVDALPDGTWIVAGDSGPQWSLDRMRAWVATTDASGAITRAMLLESPDASVQLTGVVSLTESQAIVVGSLGTRAFVASIALPELRLLWQLALDAPFDCGGREGCWASAGAVDAARLDAGRVAILASASIQDRVQPWLIEVSADGMVAGQALLAPQRGEDSFRPEALAPAEDGVLVATTAKRTPYRGATSIHHVRLPARSVGVVPLAVES